MTLPTQLIWLLVLAIPISCVTWTVTHEEIFREPREYCVERSRRERSLFARKLFYVLTCEYCFSHYVTILFLAITRFTLLLDGWRGYVLAGFSLVWIANLYMSLFGRLRLDIKSTRIDIRKDETELGEKAEELDENRNAPPEGRSTSSGTLAIRR